MESGINTIEFRLSNGTVDPNIWIQNINLYGGIIAVSERIAQIQKSIGAPTQEEQRLLDRFEKIKSNELTEEEKMQTLIDLIIPKEDRQIYINRYNANSKLLHENFEFEKKLDEKISKKPINLDSIIQKILFEDNPVTGQDFYTGLSYIENDLERENDIGR